MGRDWILQGSRSRKQGWYRPSGMERNVHSYGPVSPLRLPRVPVETLTLGSSAVEVGRVVRPRESGLRPERDSDQ